MMCQVVDGTSCDDEGRRICVDGECSPVGCDGLLGSDTEEDKCRVCGGDGSSCQTVTGRAANKPSRSLKFHIHGEGPFTHLSIYYYQDTVLNGH